MELIGGDNSNDFDDYDDSNDEVDDNDDNGDYDDSDDEVDDDGDYDDYYYSAPTPSSTCDVLQAILLIEINHRVTHHQVLISIDPADIT